MPTRCRSTRSRSCWRSCSRVPGTCSWRTWSAPGAVLVLHRRQAAAQAGVQPQPLRARGLRGDRGLPRLVGSPVAPRPDALDRGGRGGGVAAATVSVVTVSVVIWVHQNRVNLGQLRAVVSVALAGAVFNACVGPGGRDRALGTTPGGRSCSLAIGGDPVRGVPGLRLAAPAPRQPGAAVRVHPGRPRVG